MGLMSVVGSAAIDSAKRKAEFERMMRGRTDEQKKAIRYFMDEHGCMSKGVSDSEYDAMVKAIVDSNDWKKKALNKIGLDEDQLKEIDPIHFEGFYFDEKKTFAKYGEDGIWRSSAYQISWLFFSADQVYLYQYTFNMDEDGKKDYAVYDSAAHVEVAYAETISSAQKILKRMNDSWREEIGKPLPQDGKGGNYDRA